MLTRMKSKRLVLAPLAIFVCSLSAQGIPAGAPPAIPNPSPSIIDYKVGEGDNLEFKFFYNPELNFLAQVRPDGKISFDLIGDVLTAGRSLPEIRAEVENRFGPILNRPSVNIIVRTFAAQKIFVGGEVNRPASIPLVSPLTAYDALLEAGGTKRSGSLSRVILIRKGPNGNRILQTLNLKVKMVAGVPTILEPVILLPFDVLIVPETRIAKLDRTIDEYVRQLIPGNLTGGFSYLFNPLQVATQ